jgi:nucleotide-binding universal stress UspA family protein
MNILVPTDFSENAQVAIDYVYNHFNTKNLNVWLIHSIKEPKSTTGVLLRLDNLMKKDAEEDMGKLLSYCKETYNAEPKTIIKQGYLTDWVEQYGASYEIDLIVMGTNGESNLEERLFGSVTESVIRTSNIPVFAIPHTYKATPIRQFILATNKKELAKLDFIQEFLERLDLENPSISILTVDTPDEDEPLPKSIPLNGYQIGVQTIKADTAVEGINAYIDQHEVDILALYHSRNSRLDYFFNRSTTKLICSNTQLPILVIPLY